MPGPVLSRRRGHIRRSQRLWRSGRRVSVAMPSPCFRRCGSRDRFFRMLPPSLPRGRPPRRDTCTLIVVSRPVLAPVCEQKGFPAPLITPCTPRRIRGSHGDVDYRARVSSRFRLQHLDELRLRRRAKQLGPDLPPVSRPILAEDALAATHRSGAPTQDDAADFGGTFPRGVGDECSSEAFSAGPEL